VTDVLQQLIRAARFEAEGGHTCRAGHLWETEGGRSCPLGWEDCSQPVFHCARCDDYDYGEPGGPGSEHCNSSACPHNFEPPPIVCTECGQDHPCGTWGPCAKGLEALKAEGL
jgi:hypothetical protein